MNLYLGPRRLFFYFLTFALFLFTQKECYSFFINNVKDQSSDSIQPLIYYKYKDREHSFQETTKYVSLLYGVNWITYYLTQPDTFRKNGSLSKYRKNFLHFVYDKDEPVWNWMVHPYTGSQVYLIYRANGYSSWDAFFLTAIQSLLFETTVEIYTEPASIQDIYQTPVYGSILGFALENISLALLNNSNAFGKVIGHLINPSTLFWFFEGRVQVYPTITGKNEGKVSLLINY